MSRPSITFGIALLACVATSPFAFADPSPIFTLRTTSIRNGCTTLAPSRFVRHLCNGIGPYSLVVEADNLRETLAIRTTTGDSQLDLFKTVSAAPGRLGDTMTWLLNGGSPVALIMTLKTDSDPDSDLDDSQVLYDQTTLVIVKLDPDHSCVVNTVSATSNPQAMDSANELAEQAQDYGCL